MGQYNPAPTFAMSSVADKKPVFCPTQKTGFSLALLSCFAFVLMLTAACQSTPTPTPAPSPTNTVRPTRTPFPTLTPRVSPTVTATPVVISAVVTDTLRLRAQPNTTSEILGRLKKDTTVMLLSRTDDNVWYSVEYPTSSGKSGWIFGEVVVPNGDTTLLPVGFVAPKPPPGSISATVKTGGDPLRMRSGPGTNYDVIVRIPDTTRMTLIAKSPDGKWYETIYPPDSGQQGWISGDFVTLAGSPDAMQILQPPPTPTPGPTALPRPTRAANAPSGGSILVSSDQGGASDLYDIGENGVTRRQLTRAGSAFGARYSPDGERIVFYRTVAISPSVVNHIFVMDFNGQNLSDLSTRAGGTGSDSDPDWSPDGARVVFVRTPRAGAPELWTMNADGGGAKLVLTLSPATGVVEDYSPMPRWSPDGGRIAYAAVPSIKTPGAPLYPSIFVANTNGSGTRQLTDNDLINTNPVWSPDGSQIAYAAKDFINRQNWRVWIMNASGGDQRVLINPPGGDPNNGVEPSAWRGNRLLLAGWTGNWNVFLANAGGGGLDQVTNRASDEIPTDWLP